MLSTSRNPIAAISLLVLATTFRRKIDDICRRSPRLAPGVTSPGFVTRLLQSCFDGAPDDGQLKCRLAADAALFHQLHLFQALDQLFGQPLVANQPSFPRLALAPKKRDRAECVPLAPGKALCRLGWAGCPREGCSREGSISVTPSPLLPESLQRANRSPAPQRLQPGRGHGRKLGDVLQ